ncbi:Recombination endonuclease VII [Actinomadura madurae]|uniref:Recombination endonuclease VII n=1 Tax=Actinomadura madurae TaxID=1993 RepID=A0A1I5ES64_9ACTN|nr:endonuclease domain-containing protein [Actinomadura madurae]SFO14354.1 Recombination endonuclease VII [Actinomadura madurae]
MKGDTTSRGYGWRHQQARRIALANMEPGQPCARCGQPMSRAEPLDLDHTDDRAGYRGLAHRSCNRSAGAAKGNAGRAKPVTSRRW